jgi:predicted ABC-type sugar transport system permease subunit
LYTYNAIKLFPLLVLTLGVYEFLANRPVFMKNLRHIIAFALLTVVLISPLLYHWTVNGFGNR